MATTRWRLRMMEAGRWYVEVGSCDHNTTWTRIPGTIKRQSDGRWKIKMNGKLWFDERLRDSCADILVDDHLNIRKVDWSA